MNVIPASGMIYGLVILGLQRFPRLFNPSQDKASSIANMGIWDGLNSIWNFKWRRSLRNLIE